MEIYKFITKNLILLGQHDFADAFPKVYLVEHRSYKKFFRGKSKPSTPIL